MIWKQEIDLKKLDEKSNINLSQHVGMKLTSVGDDYLEGNMPVVTQVHQPFGVLHGGASCVMAETLGSIAANCCLDNSKEYAVGLEINANHVRPVSEGLVIGRATALHIGKTTHIWEIKIHDEQSKLVCVSRLTMAIIQRK